MYAQSIVEERIEMAQKELGFRLEYHSPEECDDFKQRLERRHEDAYVKAKRAAQGSQDPTRDMQIVLTRELCNPMNPKLNSDEVRWMENERALVMCDAAYFLTRYYMLLDDGGIFRRFQFRSGQKILFNCIAEMEAMRISIEILLAKARQLGMTTLVAGIMLLKTMFSHGVSSVTASADDDKTKEMVQKIFMAYDALEWWLRPLYTKRSEGAKGYLKFGSINSGVIFQHGNQTNPIAMGTTIVGYHLSEVSSYGHPENLIDVGLFKAVHPNPRIVGILESTCKGDTGWWNDSYWDAKKGWPKHQSRLMALFLPFCCAEDMYPNETEKRAHPIPEGWRPEPETRQMVAESEVYVQSNQVLAKVLMRDGKQWRMSPEQSYYWEWNFVSAKRKGTEKSWFQEMPHTDKAAFQGSYDNVFGKDVIAEVNSRRETRYDAYGIIGQSIEERHEPNPDDVDYEEPRIIVPWNSRRGSYQWEFVPMNWLEPEEIRRENNSHMGKLFVYRHPEPGYDYAIGVDTSNGIGRDGTAIAVSRRGRSPQEQDIQVAEFRDNRVSHVEAFAWAMSISAYYAKYMKPEYGIRQRQPYVAIEQIAAVGDTCQLQMSNMGYNRFHQMTRYDAKPQDMRKQDARRRGWYTFGWSRAMLTDGFVVLVQNGWYKVNSAYTIWEMDHWEVHYTDAGKNKFEHSEDATDDGLFANAMAAFCVNDMTPMADRTAKRFTGEEGQKPPELDLGQIAGMTIPTSPIPRMARHGRAGRLTSQLFGL